VEENPPVPGPSDRFNVGDGEHDSIVNLTGPGTNIPQSQGIGSPDSSALSVVPLDSQQKMKYRYVVVFHALRAITRSLHMLTCLAL
jgi:hypothetical protein